MAHRKIAEPVGEGNLPSRLVARLKKDKDLGETINLAGGSLISDTPYYVSTQCATLDYAIGRPGVPAGKVTTLFGREGSGKSTIAQHILAQTQQMGGIAMLIDSEQRFDRERAQRLGLNLDDLIVVQGATLEQAFADIENVVDGVREEDIDTPVTVVYDSLAGSVPEKRLQAEVGDVLVGQVARFVGAELPRLKIKISKLGVALVIVNQIRSRVRIDDPRNRAGNERNKVLGAQHAMLAEWPLLFESALMIYVNSIALLGEEEPTGLRARATMRKCGISPHEMWKAEFDIDYLTGVDKAGSKFELLETLKHITGGGGGWYQFADSERFGEKKFQRRQFAELLEQYPELERLIEEAPTQWTR